MSNLSKEAITHFLTRGRCRQTSFAPLSTLRKNVSALESLDLKDKKSLQFIAIRETYNFIKETYKLFCF
jgi:hypothetical protein